MYFIKCNHCGFLNEIQTEYQVFCQKCNKKMENNFRDWQTRNPGGTMDDFKKLVCISDEEIQKQIPQSKKTRKNLKYWIGFAIFFAVATAVGTFMGERLVSMFTSHGLKKEILSKEWVTQKYGEGLTVSTPFSLNSKDLPVTDDVRMLIDHSSTFSNEMPGLMIAVNSVLYKPEAGQLSLQGAASGSLAEIKSREGVSDFDYTEDPVRINEIQGISQHGTFMKSKQKTAFLNVIYLRDRSLYEVVVIYYADDDVALEAATRVINSIKIE